MADITKCAGLFTFFSELEEPVGALETADNVVIDKDDTITPRRGFGEYGDDLPLTSDRLKQLIQYRDRLIRHYSTVLQFDNGSGTFSDFNGSYSELETGLRIKYQEANGNLYFTTTEGIKKISATAASEFSTAASYITNAGGPKALDLTGLLSPATGGFLLPQSKVAYRVVWGIKDANNNLILGAPSSRLVVQNNTRNIQTSVFTVSGALSAGEYFLIDLFDGSDTSSYFVYFTDGTTAVPNKSDTIGRLAIPALNTGADNAQRSSDVGNGISDAISSSLLSVSVDTAAGTVTLTPVSALGTISIAESVAGTTNVTVANASISDTYSANVDLTFTVPSGITTSHFYQIYRTAILQITGTETLDNIDPGEEHNLIDENFYTSGTSITVTDMTPESFRETGAPLYTNPISGRGILQANEKPPVAKDLALFRGSLFFSNTKTVHRLQFNMLSVADLVSGTSKFVVGNASVAREYTFRGATEVTQLVVDSRTNTTAGGYFLLNSASNERKYYVWFDKTGSDTDPAVAGRIGVRVDVSAAADTSAGTQAALIAAFANIEDFTVVSSTPVAKNFADGDVNTTNENITIASHGFFTGTRIQLTTTGVLPTGLAAATDYWVIRVDANTIRLAASLANAIAGTPAVDITAAAGGGTHTVTPNASSASVTCVKHGNVTDASIGSALGGTYHAQVTTQGDGEDASTQEVLLSSLASVGQAIDETARSLVNIINQDSSSPVYAFYLSGAEDLPGIILLENRSLAASYFYVAVNQSAIADNFSPELPVTKTITAIEESNERITIVGHGLSTGNQIYIYGTNSTPALLGTYTVTVVDADNFTVGTNITVDGTTGYVFLTSVKSDNETFPNRVYFSKTDQPEAVPLLNYLDIGPKNKEIKRIIALRDNLFVLKEDGVYIITGSSASNSNLTTGSGFSYKLLSNSTQILAPDSAQVLNNQIYVLSNQGVVSISEGGGDEIKSRQIENLITSVANSRFTNYKTIAFGVSYENDRAYILWLPTTTSDTVATQGFRFNTLTRTWTRFVKSVTCGTVLSSDDKMYLGAGDTNYLLQERKNGDRTDHCDRNFDLSIPPASVDGTEIELSSITNVAEGDVLVQTQYVTVAFFNRLLRKLDLDPGPSDDDFIDELEMVPGDNIQTKCQLLNTKLQSAVTGYTSTSFASSDFATIQTNLNTLIGKLNDAGVSGTVFKNYQTSTGTTAYEVLITEVNTGNSVTINLSSNLMEGPVTVYKGFRKTVVWQPVHFDNPSAFKQVREGTILFDQNNFYSGTVSYSTDISQEFEDIEIFGQGTGNWGEFEFGAINYGGGGDDVPARSHLPRNKQRCRYVNVKWAHVNARELFSIVGITLAERAFSTKAYR